MLDPPTVTLIVGVFLTAVGNTALFIWRLVAIRDDILKRLKDTENEIEERITLMKASMDVQIDSLRREMVDHKVKIAEEYLRKDSFHLAMNKLETSTSAALAKVETSVWRVEERIEKAINSTS